MYQHKNYHNVVQLYSDRVASGQGKTLKKKEKASSIFLQEILEII